MIMFLIIWSCVIIALASSLETPTVTIGDESNFARLISDHEYALVKFYAPWCGHCKALAPEYEKASSSLSAHKPSVVLIKVDATVEEELAEKYAVRGFPSLKWFRKGVVSEYSGGRTEKTIVEWVKKKTGPSSTMLSSRDRVEEFSEGSEVVVVAFMPAGASEARDAFDTVAYEDDTSGVAYGMADPSLASVYDVVAPAVVMFKKFDEGVVHYVNGNDWNVVSLKEFVRSHSMPLLVPFTEETAPKIFGGERKTHMLIFADIDDHSNIRVAMEQASKAYRGDMMFITIGKKNTRIIEFFGVEINQYPTARLVVMGGSNLKKYLFAMPPPPQGEEGSEQDGSGALSLESLADISRFISAFKGGNLHPDMKSEKEIEPNDGPVTVVVGTTFDKYVANQEEDVVVDFYAPWCGHCKRLAPVWEELGITFKDVKTIRIAKMDATANEHEAVDVSGFPSIMMWPAGADAMSGGIVYEGVRELAGFLEFIEEHAVHKYELPQLHGDEL